MNCVSKELYSGIVYSSSASTVCLDLKERFDKIDCSRIFQIHKEIATIRQGTSSVSGYFSKLRLLWVEFDSLAPVLGCDCAKSREFVVFMEMLKLLQFLMGLNESYEQARSQLLMMVPVPTINKAYSMLMERESQRSMTNNLCTNEGGKLTALMTMKGGPGQMPRRNFNLYCDYCKMKGHTREGCYKLIGYPTDFKVKKKIGANVAAHNVTIEDHKRQDTGVGNINEADKCSPDDAVRGPYFTP
ncbi:uncharacterized protein LOC142178547 [Nicotiana tabacum]|uniref:Uncharacterized protein LOC142178547 n=1 Tax=Nicotiana tabacum TaxID=4097 RepID=A0AC58U4K0_TOBAC